jgi:hypothetical protein
VKLADNLRRIRVEVRDQTTPAERTVWYAYMVLIIVMPALGLILLFAGGSGAGVGIGLLIGAVVLYAIPMSPILKDRSRRRDARVREQ